MGQASRPPPPHAAPAVRRPGPHVLEPRAAARALVREAARQLAGQAFFKLMWGAFGGHVVWGHSLNFGAWSCQADGRKRGAWGAWGVGQGTA